MSFLRITSYRNEIERCRLSHCVQLAESHQLMCIVHIDILRSSSELWDHETWGHLRSKFDWPFGVNKCMFRCVLTIEIYWSSNYFSSVLRSQINQENHCCLRSLIWPQRSTVDLRYFKCTPSASSRYEHHARFSPRSSGSIGDRTAGIPTDPCPPPPRHVERWEKPFTGEDQIPCAWLFNCVFMSKIGVTSWKFRTSNGNGWTTPLAPIRKCCIRHRILNILHV